MSFAFLLGGGFFFGSLWLFLESFLRSSYGFDLTDEGLYLLSVDGPGLESYWSFPFGWNLRWLYLLSGSDIATYRTAGAFLLFVAGMLFGLAAGFAFRNSSPKRFRQQVHPVVWLASSSFLGGAGTLFYYAGLVRTPSYNWLNLFGLLIATTGLLLVLAFSRRSINSQNWIFIFSASAVGFGLFLTLPAKPSTAVFFILLGCLVLLFSHKSVRSSLLWGLAASSATALWVFGAFLTGIWPSNFLEVFFDVMKAPVAHPSQTVLGAVVNVPSSFLGFFEDLSSLTMPQAAVIVSGLVMLLTGVIFRGRLVESFLLTGGGIATLIGTLAIARVSLPPVLVWPAESRWVFQPFVSAALLFLLILILSSRLQTVANGQKGYSWSRISLVFLLFVNPIIFGFGSTHEPYRQAALALVFWVVLGVNLMFDAEGVRFISVSGAYLALVFLLLSTVYADNMAVPYRMAPMNSQNSPLDFGPGRSELFVNPELKEELDTLRSAALKSGWAPGDPLVGLVWRWNASVPYFLGAQVPESLMMTIFGYDPAPEIADYNINIRSGSFPWEDAWVLTSNPNSDKPDWRQVREATSFMDQKSGLTWPDDYELVHKQANYGLWKPVR